MSVQLITYAILGYGAPYLFNYTRDKLTSTILNKTTDVVKKKVTDVMYRNKPIDAEYEYINIDDNGNIISEPIMFVTSNKNSLIDQSWNDIGLIGRTDSRVDNRTDNRTYKEAVVHKESSVGHKETTGHKRLGSTTSLSSLTSLTSLKTINSNSPSPVSFEETILDRTLSHSAIEEYIEKSTN